MGYEARKVRVNGTEMSVVVAGEGPDVPLVHGYPDTHDVCRKQIPALVAAGYRVIAPDTRACGETEICRSGCPSCRGRRLTAGLHHYRANWCRIEGANHWLQPSGAERFNPLLFDYLK